MNPTLIQRALEALVGLPLCSIGRAANMLWLHFGELREVSTRRGGTKTVGDWAIHVQCAWRLRCEGCILVACRDFYYSPAGEDLEDWDVPGKSRFDHAAASLQVAFDATPPTVTSLAADDVGGFSLELSRGYTFDVFPDNSSRDEYSEHWRLLGPNKEDSHFVVHGAGITDGDA